MIDTDAARKWATEQNPASHLMAWIEKACDEIEDLRRQLKKLKRGLANNNTDFQLAFLDAFLDAYLDSFRSLRAEIGRLRGALEWYGEQARLARLIHSEGDAGRHALAADGGEKAHAALNPKEDSDE